MTARLNLAISSRLLLALLLTATPALAQGGRGMMGDPSHMADMEMFHQLFDHRADITRRVIKHADGIETLTESTKPEVTRLLQAHVASMLARVKEERPIHRRDPLFAELFRYADQISARQELTANGVRVIETSKDPYVVKLLQAHADVVSAFIENGRAEMMKNHPLPPRDPRH
jgi:hypothetical protein